MSQMNFIAIVTLRRFYELSEPLSMCGSPEHHKGNPITNVWSGSGSLVHLERNAVYSLLSLLVKRLPKPTHLIQSLYKLQGFRDKDLIYISPQKCSLIDALYRPRKDSDPSTNVFYMGKQKFFLNVILKAFCFLTKFQLAITTQSFFLAAP